MKLKILCQNDSITDAEVEVEDVNLREDKDLSCKEVNRTETDDGIIVTYDLSGKYFNAVLLENTLDIQRDITILSPVKNPENQ